jgi:hypothetical protein
MNTEIGTTSYFRRTSGDTHIRPLALSKSTISICGRRRKYRVNSTVHQLAIPFETNVQLEAYLQDVTFPLATTVRIVQETMVTRCPSMVDYYLPVRIHTLLPDPMEAHLVQEEYHHLQDIVDQVEAHLMEEEAEYLLVVTEVAVCLPVVVAEAEYLPAVEEEHLLQEDLPQQV